MLVNEVNLEICAAYGSSKDISVYSNVGLKPESIFIVGKISRKQQGQAQSLIEGNISPAMHYHVTIRLLIIANVSQFIHSVSINWRLLDFQNCFFHSSFLRFWDNFRDF